MAVDCWVEQGSFFSDTLGQLARTPASPIQLPLSSPCITSRGIRSRKQGLSLQPGYVNVTRNVQSEPMTGLAAATKEETSCPAVALAVPLAVRLPVKAPASAAAAMSAENKVTISR